MNNVECESCVKRKTMYCPNTFKCYVTKDKPYWQNRIMLLEENKELHSKINKAIEYINKHSFFVDDTGYNKIIGYPKERYNAQELLEILKDSE